jgi:hypothetical protein
VGGNSQIRRRIYCKAQFLRNTIDKAQFPVEAMDGDKAQFLRKTVDKAQFPMEAMDGDKA